MNFSDGVPYINKSAYYSSTDIRFSNLQEGISSATQSIVHWSVFSSERAVKDTLKVTVYRCGNLFWAHFSGSIPAGWTISNTQYVYIPIIENDTNLSKSVLVAPPQTITKYAIPTDITNMRISLTVRDDGQLGISRVAEPFKGNATTTIAGYMETCDIFWAHIEN